MTKYVKCRLLTCNIGESEYYIVVYCQHSDWELCRMIDNDISPHGRLTRKQFEEYSQ